MIFLEAWWKGRQHRYCLIYIMTRNWGGMCRRLKESCLMEKSQSLAQFPDLTLLSRPRIFTNSGRGQIPMRKDPEIPGPMAFTWVVMNWGKNNSRLFQKLFDMGCQLILIPRYPKCYHTNVITCKLAQGVAEIHLGSAGSTEPSGRHFLENCSILKWTKKKK